MSIEIRYHVKNVCKIISIEKLIPFIKIWLVQKVWIFGHFRFNIGTLGAMMINDYQWIYTQYIHGLKHVIL